MSEILRSATIPVSRETLARLELFTNLVLKWNKAVNLISKGDEDRFWDRHVLDCLQLSPCIGPGSTRLIDMGSGAGLPGLVLALASNLKAELIEADQRKATFLREAARITEADVIVHNCRLEAAHLPRSEIVTARALCRLDQLLSHANKFLAPSGKALFPKGPAPQAEIEEARQNWAFDAVTTPTRLGTIVTVTNLRPRPRP